jgi:hypothetical protein
MRGVARTAVVAGTATAVSNRVSRRQANRWSQQQMEEEAAIQQAAAQQVAAQQAAAPPPPPAAAPAAPAAIPVEQLKELAQLKEQGILTEEEFAAQKAKLLGG